MPTGFLNAGWEKYPKLYFHGMRIQNGPENSDALSCSE